MMILRRKQAMLRYAVPVAAAGVLVAGFAVAPAPEPGVPLGQQFARAQGPAGHPGGTANPVRSDIRDARAEAPSGVGDPTDNEIIEEYCVRCHNERRLLGNMSLEEYDAANAPGQRRAHREDDPQAARGADAAAGEQPAR